MCNAFLPGVVPADGEANMAPAGAVLGTELVGWGVGRMGQFDGASFMSINVHPFMVVLRWERCCP